MANPSYWVFKRGNKWHSGWRDQFGRCHSKVQPFGVSKTVAAEYARKQAVNESELRATGRVSDVDMASAISAFLARADVKAGTHDLNSYHLERFVGSYSLRRVDQLTKEIVNDWLCRLKTAGANPGGQSLSLRVIRAFARFCCKKGWLVRSPFEDFKIPKSQFVGRYLSSEERAKLLSINPKYPVDKALFRALTFGLYSLLRISQVFSADWSHFKAPDHLWIPGIKGQAGRWIRIHPKALSVMGVPQTAGQIFDYWSTLSAFREAVYKKARREHLHGVRFHETKHTGISALLEAGYSIPEVCRISGNSHRTIMHYAHTNEQRVFEKWKSFEYQDRGSSTVP